MIAVLALMLRYRWRRMLTLLLLAAFTYGVAVAVPAYLAAADRSMIGTEVAHATPGELGVFSESQINLGDGRDRTYETGEPRRLSAPWLTTTFAVDVNVDTADEPPGTDPAATVPQLLYRQGYCAHVTLEAGRCPVAAREVLIGPDLAALLHVGIGDNLPLWWVTLGPFGWVVAPGSLTVSVVGVYQPTNAADPYWGTENYFAAAGRPLPILAERGTIDALAHGSEVQDVDATLNPGVLTDASLASTRRWVASAVVAPDGTTVGSQVPALLDRIDADRRTIREVLPDVALALIMLGCFVLFLAATQAAQDRRVELGVIRLRGVAGPDRWWLGAGDSVVPVLLGIPVGLLTGGLLATGAAALTLHGAGVASATGGRTGLLTIAAMLFAVLAAHVRPLSLPVADALRRIPARLRGWRSATGQILAATLAVVAVAQLYLQPGPLTGVMLIAPALIVVTLGLIAGAAVLPIAASIGRRALASPRRVGSGLGILTVARRPGAHLLLAVQVVAVGLTGFAAAEITAAADARTVSVRLDLGASRVIDAGEVQPAQLLSAVRTADPSGRYAMAVVSLPVPEAGDPPVLALDASRLASTATWPAQARVPAPAVAAALHPVFPQTPSFTGSTIALTIEAATYQTNFGDPVSNPQGAHVDVSAVFDLADGTGRVAADLGDLRLGTVTYRADLLGCGNGCRFTGIVVKPREGTGLQADLTIRSLTAGGVAVPLPLGDDSRWRTGGVAAESTPPVVTGSPAGLHVDLATLSDVAEGLTVSLVDSPARLPVAVAGGVPVSTVEDADGSPVASVPDGPALATLPGVGTSGGLVDLAYLVQAETTTNPVPGQVWLAAGTPPSVISALASAGVVTIAEHTATNELAYLAGQGPAIGVRFQLVAAIAGVLLAAACILLVAGVEREARATELRTLRVQGLVSAAAGRAALASHLSLVVAATVAGAVASAVTWWLTGPRLPVFIDGTHTGLPASAAPWWAIVIGVAGSGAVLAAGAIAASVSLHRRVTRSPALDR